MTPLKPGEGSETAEELEAEVAACVEFLSTEMGWEYFRAEMLYVPQSEAAQHSKNNALMLKRFLEDSGHGLGFLAKHRDLEQRCNRYRQTLELIGRETGSVLIGTLIHDALKESP